MPRKLGQEHACPPVFSGPKSLVITRVILASVLSFQHGLYPSHAGVISLPSQPQLLFRFYPRREGILRRSFLEGVCPPFKAESQQRLRIPYTPRRKQNKGLRRREQSCCREPASLLSSGLPPRDPIKPSVDQSSTPVFP